jgi:hypothetical protein
LTESGENTTRYSKKRKKEKGPKQWLPEDLFPNAADLTRVLGDCLRDRGLADDTFAIVNRDRSGRYSTYANEVITCTLRDGRELRVLCKYARSNAHTGFGHRRGLDYETMVYRDVLEPLRMSSPTYYGSHVAADGGERWLMMEFIPGGLRVDEGPVPAAIAASARWIGTFHAEVERVSAALPPDSFILYDRDYYAGWARRTLEFSEPFLSDYPWLPGLCARFEDYAAELTKLPQTLIHGEYTVHNILLRDTLVADDAWEGAWFPDLPINVAPLDWESAALAFGEIDLALVTDGKWSDEIEALCHAEYCRARWGVEMKEGFRTRLRAAQVYMHLRWLGSRAEKTWMAKNSFRFESLRSAAAELGLI